MFAIDSIDDGLRLVWDSDLILDYHFQTGGPRTYWHPLRLPNSPPLTMDRPGDHVHHQGMWVAWKKVNGVNFWEQPKPGGDPNGSRSRWCGFAGKHREDGQVYGVTVLDHPCNPRYRTTWWVRNSQNYALIQPCLCYHEPFELAVGDTLELKYRIVLHEGYVDPVLIVHVLPD